MLEVERRRHNFQYTDLSIAARFSGSSKRIMPGAETVEVRLQFKGENDADFREYIQLGNYNFINLTDTVQRAYISYVFDEKPTPQARYREGGLNLESAPPVAETFRWKVYPNPFSTTVNV